MNKLLDFLKRYLFFRNKFSEQKIEIPKKNLKELKKRAKKAGLIIDTHMENLLKEYIKKEKIKEYWREN